MKKINLKGVTPEAITGVLILVLTLVNAVLQMFGLNVLPIENGDVSNAVSSIAVVLAALYNAYKNRNISTASQVAQNVTDAIKAGEVAVEDVQALIDKAKRK